MRNVLNSEWISGYTQALLDLRALTSRGFVEDLRTHQARFSYKTFIKFLDFCIENRRFLREKADRGGFVRCIGRGEKDMEFECFEGKF